MRTRWILTLALVLAMLLPGASLAEPMTYYLTPSLTGDDTDQIRAAFAEALLHPGSTIEFGAGDFYLSDSITIEGFEGTIRGQGAEASVLKLKEGAPFPATAWDPVLSSLWGYDWYWPVMLTLSYHDRAEAYSLTISDLGFEPVGAGEVWTWAAAPADFVEALVVGTAALGEVPPLNATFRNLRIVGDADATYIRGKNLMDGIVIGTARGTFRFAGCWFETMAGLPVNTALLEQSSVIIGGARAQDHVYMADADMGGTWCWACKDTVIDVTNVEARDIAAPVFQALSMDNTTVRVAGVEAYDSALAGLFGSAGRPSTYLWEDNTVRTAGAAFTVVESGDVRSQVVIRNNNVEGLGQAAIGVLTSNTQGTVITNNRFTGIGAAAMALGAPEGDDSGIVVKGNNVQGWEGDVAIWLGPGTSGNTVVGGGKDIVLDEGTDNIVTGTGDASGAIGEAVREAMLLRRDVRDLWK